MGIGRSIGNLFKSIFRFFQTSITIPDDSSSASDRAVEQFDTLIQEKRASIDEVKRTLGNFLVGEQTRIDKLAEASKTIETLEVEKADSAGEARELAAAMQAEGRTPAEIRSSLSYRALQAKFELASVELAGQQGRIDALENAVVEAQQNTEAYRKQVIQLIRQAESLEREADDTVADILTAEEEKDMADLLRRPRESRVLEDLRAERMQARIDARVARELSGLDDTQSYQQAAEELDLLIGMSDAVGESPGDEKPLTET